MKRSVKTFFACALALVFALQLGAFGFAEKGPLTSESDMWPYSRLVLNAMDENYQQLTKDTGEGYSVNVSLPLYEDYKVTAQEGAVYDLATNTLTLTDFNKGNYELVVNLMGDDFTLCVKGDCKLAILTVNGGGVMQPKRGGSLHLTGDGTLTINKDRYFNAAISFSPQEEDKTVFAIDSTVTLKAYGVFAVEVYACFGDFELNVDGKPVAIEKQQAVRNLTVSYEGYSHPGKTKIHLCRNAADPDGLYNMSEWFDEYENPSYVSVERYIHIKKFDVYVEDYQWATKTSGGNAEVKFDTLADANAAGFTYILDGKGETQWLEVNSLQSWYSHDLYQDADGNLYAKDYEYVDGESHDIALTIEPLEEIPGQYAFFKAPGVDPDTLTEVREDRVIENMYDYHIYDEFTVPLTAPFMIGDVDGDGQVLAGDARYALRAAVNLDDTAEGLDFSDPLNRCFRAADINNDKNILAEDARLILRSAVGLCDLEDPSTW